MTRKLNIDKAYSDTVDRRPAGNRRLAKKRAQWLNEALFSASSFVEAGSFVLPCLLEAVRQGNRQLLVAAKRCASPKRTEPRQ